MRACQALFVQAQKPALKRHNELVTRVQIPTRAPTKIGLVTQSGRVPGFYPANAEPKEQKFVGNAAIR